MPHPQQHPMVKTNNEDQATEDQLEDIDGEADALPDEGDSSDDLQGDGTALGRRTLDENGNQ